MKRALLIGIDTYDNYSELGGCVNDVRAIEPLLSRNEDDTPNFDCHSLTSDMNRVDRPCLLEAASELLGPGADVALLYFAGHGAASSSDVVMVTQDSSDADRGVALSTMLADVVDSSVREIIIILDCCFSGGAGRVPQFGGNVAALRPGLAILSASRSDQTSTETPDARGVFSVHLCGALDGGAADVLGKVTLAGVYAYLSESFGPWDQRPTFKANLDRLHELRLCSPAVPITELRRLPELFARPEQEFKLDPSYEPTVKPKHPEHEAIFSILQRCRAAKLVEPVGADHMYFAAMNSQACRLTALGRHYLRMANLRRL